MLKNLDKPLLRNYALKYPLCPVYSCFREWLEIHGHIDKEKVITEDTEGAIKLN